MFGFNLDRRTIYIIIAVMLGIALLQFATNPGQLMGLLLSAPGVLIAITFHEFAHGYVAYKLGDNTAKNEGRLSLNPLDHLDPIYYAIYKFIGVPFILSNIGKVIMNLIIFTISINIGLGVFNLIPLPPLDGSKIIMPFLPYNAKQFFINNEQIFYIVFILIWVTGIAGTIITPAINWLSDIILSFGRLVLGL